MDEAIREHSDVSSEVDTFNAWIGSDPLFVFEERDRLTRNDDETHDFDHARKLIDEWFGYIRDRCFDGVYMPGASDQQICEEQFTCRTCGWKMFRDIEQVECYLSLTKSFHVEAAIAVPRTSALQWTRWELQDRWYRHFETQGTQGCVGSMWDRFISMLWQREPRLRSELGEREERRQYAIYAFQCSCGWRLEGLEDLEYMFPSEYTAEQISFSRLKAWYDEEWTYHNHYGGCEWFRQRLLDQEKHNWKEEGF